MEEMQTLSIGFAIGRIRFPMGGTELDQRGPAALGRVLLHTIGIRGAALRLKSPL
jgi:hypothetical protein